MSEHYLIFVTGCTDPDLQGPYENPDQLMEAAKKAFREELKDEDALFWLEVDDQGKPTVCSFSYSFVEEALDESPDNTSKE